MNVAGGGSSIKEVQEVTFQLATDRGYTSPEMVGMVAPTVGRPFAPVEFNPKGHSYLKDLPLADTFPDSKPREISLIISEPYFSQMQLDGTKRPAKPELPTAQSTELGWVLRGAAGIYKMVQSAQVFSSLTYTAEDLGLNEIYGPEEFDFSLFWTGQNVGINPNEVMHSELTALEEKAIEFHEQTARFDPVKKEWSVRLPWKSPDLEAHRMSDNTRRAMAYYLSSGSKVKPEHREMVSEAYTDLVKQGFAEPVPPEEMNPSWPTYVMFSRPVIRMDKATTKTRIVINASLTDPEDKAKSINKMLMPGPNLLPQIMEILLRAMQKKYIFLIDVRKMFLAVPPKPWPKSSQKQPKPWRRTPTWTTTVPAGKH